MNMWTNERLRVDILPEEQLEAIHDAAMRILEETGVRLTDEPTLELMREQGLTTDTDDEQVVRFDRGFVLEQVGKAPSSFAVQGRNPHRGFVIGDDHVVLSPTGGAPLVQDLDRGRRQGTAADYTELIKLCHVAEELHSIDSGIIEFYEIETDERHLDMDYLTIRHTDKPYMAVGGTGPVARDCIDMAAIVFGGREALEATPSTFVVVNPASPLVWDDRMLGTAWEFARANQPIFVTPFIMAGGTSPITLAGAMAQYTAEILACIAIIQTIRPGCPAVFGGYVTGMDMLLGQPTLGTQEMGMATLIGGQLARRYGLPYRAGGGWTSAKVVDAQAAYETAMGLWTTFLAGTNFVLHAAGLIDGSIATSYEKLVVDLEMLRMLGGMLQMPATDDAAFALDAIADTGPGGMFLAHPHTLERFRDGVYRSPLSVTEDFDRWTAEGAPDTERRANALWKQMLESYEDPGLDDAVDAELQEFMTRRRAEIAAERD